MSGDYRVTYQEHKTTLNKMGTGLQDVWEVTFEVTAGPATGTIGRIQVPVNYYNAEEVKQRIENVLDHLQAVAGL